MFKNKIVGFPIHFESNYLKIARSSRKMFIVFNFIETSFFSIIVYKNPKTYTSDPKSSDF